MDSLQKAAWIRKALYLAAIVLLFSLSMVWRGVLPVPLSGNGQPGEWAQKRTILSQAERLELQETDPSETDADVLGSAARLALTGTRGFAVTFTWLSAIDKQKRNDFHEFEQRVQLVTLLQPNFITPWIFQSWNITYNVSVEMQGSGDMYYYIVRGIQLLAEGERRNKRSPDMRYQIAFYYQNKFGVSDQVEVLRCLYDLSCIPWSERNPANLADPTTGEINYVAFEKFCKNHPHFIRRLRGDDTANLADKRMREKLRAPYATDVIAFLRNNQDIPARYKDKSDELAEAEKQFPVLPPKFSEEPEIANPGSATLDDTAPGVGYFTAFKAARAWFSYSLLLLPKPLKDEQGKPIPGPTPPPGMRDPSNPNELLNDPKIHRVPRMPMLIIFRQGAPRAQSYQAEQEQKEGWFDGEGWRIENWFPNHPEGVVVGTGRDWSRIEWERAYAMWAQHGNDNALVLSKARLEEFEKIAREASSFQSSADNPDDEKLRRIQQAQNARQYYQSNRTTTNFPFFLATAEVERLPETVHAHKLLWQADQARKIGDTTKAIRLYKDGLDQWKRILAVKSDFAQLDRIQEETYEYELEYQRVLVHADKRVREYANKVARDLQAVRSVIPFASVAQVQATYAGNNAEALWRLPPFQGVPFPEDDKQQRMPASLRLAAPLASVPFFKDEKKTAQRDPVWTETNREVIKWFVVENVGSGAFAYIKDEKERQDQDFSSPFVGSTTPDGNPWIRKDVIESVKSKQNVGQKPPQQQQPQQPQQGEQP